MPDPKLDNGVSIAYQRARGQIGPDGSFGQGMEVGFTVAPEGVTAHVWIPLAQYNDVNVADQVNAYARRIRAVHSL